MSPLSGRSVKQIVCLLGCTDTIALIGYSCVFFILPPIRERGIFSRAPAVCGAGDSKWLAVVLARQFNERDALSHDAGHDHTESVSIGQVLSIVVAERLLVKIPKQVERLYTHVGSSRALSKRESPHE